MFETAGAIDSLDSLDSFDGYLTPFTLQKRLGHY